MDQTKAKNPFAILILIFALLACNFVAPTPAPLITSTPIVSPTSPALTVIVEPTSAATSKLPLTEADVLRVPVNQARAALDSGAAIIVDVRSIEAYQASHIKGAISIPLNEIEINPTALKLDKNQWIITYCT